jgi:hypothetical protein
MGDSTIDNKNWVGPECYSVTEHMQVKTKDTTWKVHRAAIDGALIGAIYLQLERLQDP